MLNLVRFVKDIASRETFQARLEVALLFAIIIAILIPAKYLLPNQQSLISGFSSDFTLIFAYLSLLLSLCLIGLQIYADSAKSIRDFTKLAIILIIIGILLHVGKFQSPALLLSIYTWIKIACALLVGYYVYKSKYWLKYRDLLLWVIIALGSLNSVLALMQFTSLSSLGLNIFGESPLTISGYDIAKSVAHGTTYLRGYGLMPHPNILAAILVIINLLNLYLLNKTTQLPRRIILWLTLLVTSAGVFTTLSRAGLLAFGIGISFWIILGLYKRADIHILRIVVFLFSLLLLTSIFSPWLLQRATWGDQAVVERSILNSTTIESILENSGLGSGPGTNIIVLHEKLSNQLQSWQIQPAHNYFLINIAELGIIGVAISILILFILVSIFIISLKNLYDDKEKGLWLTTLSSIAVALFVLFWFDHYFYTFWPTQVFLWIILGMMAKEIASSKELVAK